MNKLKEVPEPVFSGYQDHLQEVLSIFELLKKNSLSLKGQHDDPSVNTLISELYASANTCGLILLGMLESEHQKVQCQQFQNETCSVECSSIEALMSVFGQALISIKKLTKITQDKALILKLSNSIASLQILFDRLGELKRIKRL